MRKNVLGWLFTILLLPVLAYAADQEPLPPDQAYQFSAHATGADTISAEWNIADGYYLYHDKIKFSTDTPGIKLGKPLIPAGKKKQDPFFGQVETLRHKVNIEIPVQRGPGAGNEIKLTASAQGCADMGLCYPPYQVVTHLRLPDAAPAATKQGGAPQAISKLGGSLGLQDSSDEFLDPDQAFVLTTEVSDGDAVRAHWNIADGYYLYRDKFKFKLKAAPAGVTLGKVDLAKGDIKDDEFFGRLEVYHHQADATIPLNGPAAGSAIKIAFTYQGCATAGLCYPPITKVVDLKIPAAPTAAEQSKAAAPSPTAAPPPAAAAQEPVSEQDKLLEVLKGGNVWLILGAFFLGGLGLALTPCVFPMIPILSGIIVGQGERLTTRKAFTLSLVYVLAMAVTYTAAGIIAGMFGQNLQAAFQDPWILSIFALIFVALALSMFGFYDLQLPTSLQSKLTEISNRQRGGTLAGVAIMGFLSALIVGPCVAAPLAAALIYIGQQGDPVLGGEALFALSMGMGTPLLLIGTSGGKLLPKAGKWMDSVKAVFGVLLLGVAVWMLERILPGEITVLLWALLAIVSAVYMGALEPVGPEGGGWRKFWKGLGAALLIYGALLLVGAAAGNKDPLQPLEGFGGMYATSSTAPAGAAGSAALRPKHGLTFKRIKGLADLQRELAAASSQGKPVMLDLYADWCVSCKEFEKYTFSDPGVQQALANTVLLQADVTANDAADKALMKHFQLIGPPTILFFGRDGKERKRYRVVGYMKASEFQAHVQRAIK